MISRKLILVVGVFSAILALPVHLYAVIFSTADLDGTWHFHNFSDLPSNNNPGWSRGTITINSSGTVTDGTVLRSDGSTAVITGGSLSIASDGVISGSITDSTGTTSTISQAKMDAGKTTGALVGIDSQNFRFMGSIIKGGGSFSNSDLAGTWFIHVFLDLPSLNNPIWNRGTITVNSSGMVTGGSIVDSDGFSASVSGGSLAMNPAGELSGSISIISGGFTITSTISHGKADTSKTIVAFVGNNSQGTHGYSDQGWRFLF